MEVREAVRLAREGREEGYQALYQLTWQRSYAEALHFMKSEEDARDVVQDAYARAFRSLERLEDERRFPAWMARIVANTALNELKKRQPLLFSQTTADEYPPDGEWLEDERVDTQPEAALDQAETSRLVREILDTLPDDQRMCVLLFYMDELSVREIAGMLGISENTVKSRLSYGRKKIREKVLELEKNGTKLYALPPIAFFLWLLQTDVQQVYAAPLPVEQVLPKQAQAPAGAGNAAARAAAFTTAQKAGFLAAAVVAAGAIGTAAFLAFKQPAASTQPTVQETQEATEAVTQETTEAITEETTELSEIETLDLSDRRTHPNSCLETDDAVYYCYIGYGSRIDLMRWDKATQEATSVCSLSDGQYETHGFSYLSEYGGYLYACWNRGYAGTPDDEWYIYRFSESTGEAEQLAEGNDPILLDGMLYYCESELVDVGYAKQTGWLCRMNPDGSEKERLTQFWPDGEYGELTLEQRQGQLVCTVNTWNEEGNGFYDSSGNPLDESAAGSEFPEASEAFTVGEWTYTYTETGDDYTIAAQKQGASEVKWEKSGVFCLHVSGNYMLLGCDGSMSVSCMLSLVDLRDATMRAVERWTVAE